MRRRSGTICKETGRLETRIPLLDNPARNWETGDSFLAGLSNNLSILSSSLPKCSKIPNFTYTHCIMVLHRTDGRTSFAHSLSDQFPIYSL